MENFEHPFLYWRLTEDEFCARVVGMDIQIVHHALRKIRRNLKQQLSRKLDDEGTDVTPKIKNAQLKELEVSIRPTHEEEHNLYPQPNKVTVPIPAVWGRTGRGHLKCYLPLLKKSFQVYSEQKLDLLIKHFSRDLLRRKSPEEIYHFLIPDQPHLGTVQLQRSSEDLEKVSGHPGSVLDGEERGEDPLETRADRLPRTRRERRKASAFPDVAWEQDKNIKRVVEKLIADRANLLLVGHHGVGKSAILKRTIRRIDRKGKENVSRPEAFYRTTPRRITAGARYLGDWQQQCEEFMEALSDRDAVLWMEEFMRMFRTMGGGPEESMAPLVQPYISRKEVQLVSELTPLELKAARTLLPGFVEHFQTIRIEEMERQTVLKIFKHFREYSNRHFEIDVKHRATQVTYRMLKRFVPYERFPGKAIRFLSDCLNEALLEDRTTVTHEDVTEKFTEKSGMPEILLRDDLPLKSEELETYFSNRIIGQEQALKEIRSVVKTFKAGLNAPDRPISTMLFSGPTGVGKTATARALANYFYGKGQEQNPLVRLDMSEFQHPETIDRLIGSGNDPGKLVRQIRNQPFSVLLLDEIEKAHSSLFDALMTVLDEGRLVDRWGRVTDFRNSIIIMTSNLGADQGTSIGFGDGKQVDYRSSVREFFRPEFYNRLDRVLVFTPLEKETIRMIARKELKEAGERSGFMTRDVALEFTPPLVDYLCEIGFDPDYGARPLQRVIEQNVISKIAKYLNKRDNLREQMLEIGYDGEKVTVTLK